MSTDTTETIKEIVATCKVLKKFTDLQSARIDKLEKILARYQMTEGLEAAADVDKIKQVEA
jgi:hypothetical protein|tara:strand:- start:263 stop:445 length:183 start_codon:yes stop_codon:yes gene_type:complete